jgi:glycosyltransferase involved in cell wall biosynthesis
VKKIALIVFNYYLANSLSLISSATILAREGYDVHIFIDRFIYERSKADFADDHISVHPIDLQADARAEDAANKVKSKRWSNFIANNLADLSDKRWGGRNSVVFDLYRGLYRNLHALRLKLTHVKESLHYAFHARSLSIPSINTVERYTHRFFPSLAEFHQEVADHIDDDYVCLVGVEPYGLIAATLAANASKHDKDIPVVYYNQELLLERECHTFESKVLKALEKMCNQACSFTITQDKRRAKHLRNDNNLKAESIICVPVSGLEKAYHRKGNFFHDLYGIPREKKVLLYAGNMSWWALCVEMAEAAQTWKDNFVLVLHSWREDMKNDAYVSRIRKLTDSNKVYLSLMQVDWQKMPDLLSSADIGLVFYQNLGPNFYETGHSSNKLVQYLQVGLPLITSDFPSLRDVIDEYQCGECGNGPDDIQHLAEKIFNDYENYRTNAFRCYENEYDFSKYFKKVVERLQEIEASSC